MIRNTSEGIGSYMMLALSELLSDLIKWSLPLWVFDKDLTLNHPIDFISGFTKIIWRRRCDTTEAWPGGALISTQWLFLSENISLDVNTSTRYRIFISLWKLHFLYFNIKQSHRTIFTFLIFGYEGSSLRTPTGLRTRKSHLHVWCLEGHYLWWYFRLFSLSAYRLFKCVSFFAK